MKFSVTVSNKTACNAPVLLVGELEENIEKASRMGFDAVELHYSNPASVDGVKAARACEKSKIKVSAIATGSTYSIHKLSLTDDLENIRDGAIARIKEYIDLAQPLQSMVIIGCVRGNVDDRKRYDLYERRLAESMKQLSDYAAKKEVPLLLEAINRYENNFLNTASETCTFVKESKIPNLKVLLDTFHMNIEDVNIPDSIKESKNVLGYIHAADSNRMYPGAGHVDFGKIFAALKEIGYDGYVSAECLPLPDGQTAAQNWLAYCKFI